jgi:nucleoside triphosphate diphosphatase
LRGALDAGEMAAIKDEFGDVLFALVNLGRHLGIDAEDALRGTNDKFRKRFHHVERALSANGSSLDEASLDEMEGHWQAAKRT